VSLCGWGLPFAGRSRGVVGYPLGISVGGVGGELGEPGRFTFPLGETSEKESEPFSESGEGKSRNRLELSVTRKLCLYIAFCRRDVTSTHHRSGCTMAVPGMLW